MVSGGKVKKRETDRRRKRRERLAEIGAILLALALAFITKTEVEFSIALAAMAVLLIYAVFQLSWILDARPVFIAFVRAAVGIVVACGLLAIYGWMGWPKTHRHALSARERALFEAPLKGTPDTTVTIQMACPASDEIDCVYASNLIPIFGEAGWNVENQVTRVSLPRPMQGVVLVLHSSTDYVPKKWNEGVWTKMLPAIVPIDKAFSSVGIEPDSNSGFSVGENQVIVYIGPERDDESTPTQLTRTVTSMVQVEEDRKKGIIKAPSEK
jgi:hypothetical protein